MTNDAIEAALEAHANSPTIVDFETAYDAMRAAIAAYEQAMWRPIEEAAKDLDRVLLFKPDEPLTGDYMVSAYWGPWYSQEGGGDYWIACSGGPLRQPTHYRPLPPPPESAK